MRKNVKNVQILQEIVFVSYDAFKCCLGGNAGHLRIPVSASRTCNTADFPEITAGNQFTPIFIVTYLPAVVRGLMLAGLLGLMLTSGDSYLLLLASTVTDDVVVPIKKDMDEKKKILFTRFTCVAGAVVITAMALYVNSIYQLFKTGGGAYGAGVFLPLFLGCFWKRADAKAINAGMFSGFVIAFCFDMFLKIPLGLNMNVLLVQEYAL